MPRNIEIVLLPEQVANELLIKEFASRDLEISIKTITDVIIRKRSIDARSKQVKYRLSVDVYINETPPLLNISKENYMDCSNKQPVLIIGAGPAGLFAALRCLEDGFKPIIIERGKEVRERRRDLAAINKLHTINPNSNYCFGEGGAGTYSDGKLYTRSTKRGDVNRILKILVSYGAPSDILVDAHPHIGTNKLPDVVIDIRKTILQYGGEIHFNTLLTGLIIKDSSIKGIMVRKVDVASSSNEFSMDGKSLILATGHSAFDAYELLQKANVLIHSKPFALGVRIEHPQQLIDSIQYHCTTRNPHLPPASYSLVHQAMNRGVYSFCMCPGGIIAPCATSPGEIVVNGWSPSKRNNPFANSGMVVSVDDNDFKPFQKNNALMGLFYRQQIEQKAYKMAGSNLQAPAQRMMDFVERKLSNDLPKNSYIPGVLSTEMDDLLPSPIVNSLRESLKHFGTKMKGYLTNEAILVGVESRTSSPVRIPRDKDTLQHPQIKGFYPCGEGAGYAGGIISAAIDGENCAHMATEYLKQLKH